MESKKILIIAGGTGGHVFPALEVAQNLLEMKHQVHWLGTDGGIESKLVAKANIPMTTISSVALRGQSIFKMITNPFKIIYGFVTSFRLIIKYKPDVVLGMGGYVAGPGCLAAILARVKLFIHEQNSLAGLTNRILAPWASKIFTAFTTAFDSKPEVSNIGNPVRSELHEIGNKRKLIQNFNPKRKMRILVLGGSGGALALNQILPQVLVSLGDKLFIEVCHQTGGKEHTNTTKLYEVSTNKDFSYRCIEFIDDMPGVYRDADLVICRAGALTMAELAATGLPSILVPYPYSADGHQMKNAKYAADCGASVLLAQQDLSESNLNLLITKYYSQPELLNNMSINALKLARPQAALQLAFACVGEKK